MGHSFETCRNLKMKSSYNAKAKILTDMSTVEGTALKPSSHKGRLLPPKAEACTSVFNFSIYSTGANMKKDISSSVKRKSFNLYINEM